MFLNATGNSKSQSIEKNNSVVIVLHYIPNLTKSMGQAAKSVQIVHAAMSDHVESHLFTGRATSRDFLKALKRFNPDVVHLHGCWNIQLAAAHRIASHYGIPVITSPHGSLSPETIQKEFWKKRMPRILLYQFMTIRNSFTLIAMSQKEHDDLKALGWRKRITTIPLATSDAERKGMVDSFCAIYQKVIDTVWRNRLKPVEQQCFWQLLSADVASEYTKPEIPEETAKMFSELTPANWKALQVYALDHGVHTRLLAGAKCLGISIEHIITQLPVRFDSKTRWHSETPKDVNPDIKAKYKDNALELSLAIKVHDLYNTIQCLSHSDNCPHNIAHLLEIYEVMRWQYYDEAVFTEIIKEMGITSFASRLLAVIDQLFGLTIGFMPFDPKTDSSVSKLIQNLNNLP